MLTGALALCPRAAVLNSGFAVGLSVAKNRRCGMSAQSSVFKKVWLI